MIPHMSKRSLRSATGAVIMLAAASGGTLWMIAPVTIDNVELALADGASLRIGSLTLNPGLALISPAAAAENVALKNVSVSAGGGLYVAPSIEIAGSSLSQKDFTALLDPKAPQNVAAKLATFSAASITIPELRVERTAGVNKQVFQFRNLVFRTIAAGKAATVTADGGSVLGPPPVDAGFGAVAGRTLDLALLAKLLSEKPDPEREPKPLYAAFTFDKVQFKGGNGIQVGMNQLSSVNAKAQPGNQPQHLLSVVGQIKAADATIDVPSKTTAGVVTHWTLKEFTLQADDPRDGVPTKYRLALDTLATALPAQSSDLSMKNMIDLGFSSLAFTALAEGEWNPQSGEFAIKQVAIDGANIGSIALRGTLGKFSKDVFFAKEQRFHDITVRTLSLTVENKGLYERFVMREAKKSGKSLDQTRRELNMATVIYTTAMLEKASSGDVVQAAIAKFFQNPRKLNINVKAKNAAGVPWAELGGPKGPGTGTAEKFDVSAVAE